MPPKCKSTDYCPDQVREEAVERLARLIGEKGKKAETAAQRLRGIAVKLEKEEVEGEVAIFKALGHPSRLLILKLLKEGEMCGCELMTALNAPQSSTSHHLNLLKKAGLVKERKDGHWSYYRLSEGAVIGLFHVTC